MEIDHAYPLVKLPKETQLVLLLIREQLKVTHFFNTLQRAGIDDCAWQPHLDAAILACMGFKEIPDELMNFYVAVLEKHSARIDPDGDAESLMQQALAMYEELASKKTNPAYRQAGVKG